MRVLALILVTSVLLGVAANGPEAATNAQAALTGGDGLPAAETQPSQKPAKTKSIDDEIKALGLKPCSMSAAMGRWKKVEKSLKNWADGSAPDFAEAKTTGLTLAGMSKLIEWKKNNKKREKDAAGFDAIVTTMEASSRKLAEAAIAKDAEAVKTAAGDVNRTCADCHGRFNNK